MSALTIQKEEIQNDVDEIMSAAAIGSIKPLNSVRMQRKLNKQTALPKKSKAKIRQIVPYTQGNLTDALVHLAECFYDGQKCSLRKAESIYMNGKYASLTRVWKSNRVAKALEIISDKSEGIQFVASIPKPKVCFVFVYLYLLSMYACQATH